MPKSTFVVQMVTSYSSLEEAMRSAPDAMTAHIARSREFYERGDLLMAGAFLDGEDGAPVSTMAVLRSRSAAVEYAEGDPFLLKGMVSEWRVREWANLFGESTP
jgi:uncharacterized protein